MNLSCLEMQAKAWGAFVFEKHEFWPWKTDYQNRAKVSAEVKKGVVISLKRKIFAAILLFAMMYSFGVGAAAEEELTGCERDGRHVFVGVRYVPATEEMDGLNAYQCEKCGWEYEIVWPRTGHSWSEWVVTEEPTCTKTGSHYRACHLHGLHVESAAIPAAGHDYRLSRESATTCVEDGIDTYKCSRCGDSYSKTGVPALGHHYDIVGSTATCENDGVNSYSCLRCGNIHAEDAPALGHDYTLVVTVEVTCTGDGERTFICSHDNSEKYTEVIAAAGHDFGEWLPQNQLGKRVRVCGYCGAQEEQEIQQAFAGNASGSSKLPIGVRGAVYTFVAVYGAVAFAICFVTVYRVRKLW